MVEKEHSTRAMMMQRVSDIEERDEKLFKLSFENSLTKIFTWKIPN